MEADELLSAIMEDGTIVVVMVVGTEKFHFALDPEDALGLAAHLQELVRNG